MSRKSVETIPLSLKGIRHQLIDRLWSGALFIAIIGAPVSALRSLSTGWLTLYSFHIAIAVSVVLIYILKNKISFNIKSALLLFIFALIGVLGLFTLGVLGAGIWWLIMSSFLVSTLYNLRAGIWTVLFSTLIIITAGYCFSNDIITLSIDANTYVKTPSSWISLFMATSIMPFLVLQALASFQHATIALLNEVDRQKQQIEEMAKHDQLTGLSLLDHANEKLNSAIDEVHNSDNKVALLFLDLDGFKAVNDEHGHAAGDYVLKQTALRIQKLINDNDMAARIGGDEIIIILSSLKHKEFSAQMAQSLINELARPYYYLGTKINISCSIGISLYPDHASSAVSLRKAADAAMYKVKKSGKNAFAFVENRTDQILEAHS